MINAVPRDHRCNVTYVVNCFSSAHGWPSLEDISAVIHVVVSACERLVDSLTFTSGVLPAEACPHQNSTLKNLGYSHTLCASDFWTGSYCFARPKERGIFYSLLNKCCDLEDKYRRTARLFTVSFTWQATPMDSLTQNAALSSSRPAIYQKSPSYY